MDKCLFAIHLICYQASKIYRRFKLSEILNLKVVFFPYI